MMMQSLLNNVTVVSSENKISLMVKFDFSSNDQNCIFAFAEPNNRLRKTRLLNKIRPLFMVSAKKVNVIQMHFELPFS